MFEHLKTQLGIIDMPVKLEMANGQWRYGVLLDYVEGIEQNPNDWRFVSFNNLQRYKETESPSLIEKINTKLVSYIDINLK